MNPQFWLFAQGSDHQLNLFSHAISNFMMGPIFFHYLLLLEWKFGWGSSPPHVCFCLLSIRNGPLSNVFCIFANLCSTIVCGSNVIRLVLFSDEMHKRRGKNLTGKILHVDRQIVKDVICIFWCYYVNLIAEGTVTIPFLLQFPPFPFINAPSQMKILMYSINPILLQPLPCPSAPSF